MKKPRAPLTPNFLRKAGRPYRPVRLFDLAVLLLNVHKAATTADVGFEDADRTMDELTRRLEKRILRDPALLESALWSCNLLAERGEFSHPYGKDIKNFVRDVLGSSTPFNFNKHLIGDKE